METLKENAQLIWMIDDDLIQHFYFEKFIQIYRSNQRLLSFFNGEEAFEFMNEHRDDFALLPDVIFLDLNMPFVNGWQFLQLYAQIKAGIKKTTKIYVLSSTINKDEINRAESIPEVAGFFIKPLKPDDITGVLSTQPTNLANG